MTKKFTLLTLFLFAFFSNISLLQANDFLNEEGVLKTYLNPEEVWINEEGIFIQVESDESEKVLVSVNGIFSDEIGIYTLLESRRLIRNCSLHHQTCQKCYGCSQPGCHFRCPKPNKCQ
jgi:hypothetical protein